MKTRDQYTLGQPPQLGFSFEEAPPISIQNPLPSDPIAHYRELINQYNAAHLACNQEKVKEIDDKAHQLAIAMNGGSLCGILGEPDAPGYLLQRGTQAEPDTVPLWGQSGNFIVDVDGMAVRVKLEGIFSIGGSLGFTADIVHKDKPFLSETGYRCFFGGYYELAPNMTPDVFVVEVMRAYIQTLKPKPRKKRVKT